MRCFILLGLFIAGCADAESDGVTEDALRILVIDQVSASGDPDWFEVANTSDAPVALDDYLYVDAEGELDRAARFPAITLAPGARYRQVVTDAQNGFKLGSDEQLWIYRDCDGVLSDGVDWADGASPSGGSYVRRPSVTGDFLTVIGG